MVFCIGGKYQQLHVYVSADHSVACSGDLFYVPHKAGSVWNAQGVYQAGYGKEKGEKQGQVPHLQGADRLEK